MRTILSFILLFSAAGACAGGKPAPAEAKAVVHDLGWFSCRAPAGWEAGRDKAAETRAKIYELEFLGPRAGGAPLMVSAAYYAKGNTDFSSAEEFIRINSKDSFGRTVSLSRKYGPVRKTALGGRRAFAFERTVKEYLHPESDSEESVTVKEKFLVVPGKDGFVAFHYYAPSAVYEKNLPVFNKTVSDCSLKF